MNSRPVPMDTDAVPSAISSNSLPVPMDTDAVPSAISSTTLSSTSSADICRRCLDGRDFELQTLGLRCC
jgi:hypothetical protein